MKKEAGNGSASLTRRQALAIGIAGSTLLSGKATAALSALPQTMSGLPGGEQVDNAIINRDREWLDLESEAKLEASFRIDTPIGPSPLIRKLRYKGVPFFYIPRYGDPGSGEIEMADDEEFPGQRTVQIWVTLITLGVRNVLHGNLIGGINPEYAMCDAAIIDDLIDLKPNHPQSILPYFFKGKKETVWKHWWTRMNPVLCPDLRSAMYDQALVHHFARVHYGGTMSQTRTDRWETPAEVRALRGMGADISCTLDGTYIVYARQAGIHFATVMMVLNYGEGLRPLDVPHFSDLESKRCAESMRKTLLETIASLKNFKHQCDCFKLQEDRWRVIERFTLKAG
jgi:5'-methylthioadenosine phosphorylase